MLESGEALLGFGEYVYLNKDLYPQNASEACNACCTQALAVAYSLAAVYSRKVVRRN